MSSNDAVWFHSYNIVRLENEFFWWMIQELCQENVTLHHVHLFFHKIKKSDSDFRSSKFTLLKYRPVLWMDMNVEVNSLDCIRLTTKRICISYRHFAIYTNKNNQFNSSNMYQVGYRQMPMKIFMILICYYHWCISHFSLILVSDIITIIRGEITTIKARLNKLWGNKARSWSSCCKNKMDQWIFLY